ncbi:MAG: porin family protein [Flavobacteriaceae bacterium]
MKKIILAVATVCMFGLAQAQETATISQGIKVGGNLANWKGDIAGNNPRIGFHIGGFIDIRTSEKLSIQPELLFSSQGTKVEINFFGDHYKSRAVVNYLNVPVMFKYYAAEQFTIQAGPQVGFLLSAKEKWEGGGDSGEETISGLNSIDFGINFGLGYNINENMFIEARYNIGLSNLVKDAEGDASVQNAVFQLSLGFRL